MPKNDLQSTNCEGIFSVYLQYGLVPLFLNLLSGLWNSLTFLLNFWRPASFKEFQKASKGVTDAKTQLQGILRDRRFQFEKSHYWLACSIFVNWYSLERQWTNKICLLMSIFRYRGLFILATSGFVHAGSHTEAAQTFINMNTLTTATSCIKTHKSIYDCLATGILDSV